jgi:CDP-diglyceride synthetase
VRKFTVIDGGRRNKRPEKSAGETRMMISAKIVYWLMSVVAVLLLALTAVLLVSIASGQEMTDWWLHAVSLALLAVCVWFLGWLFRYVVRRIVGQA